MTLKPCGGFKAEREIGSRELDYKLLTRPKIKYDAIILHSTTASHIYLYTGAYESRAWT